VATTMIKTRKELIEYFSDVLSGYQAEFVEEHKTRSGWLKTQIIEVDNHKSSLFETLNNAVSDDDAVFTDTHIYSLDEPLFFCLRTQVEEEGDIYIDGLDERFVILYTLMKSKPFDIIIDALTTNSNLDKSWLPQDFMLSMDKLGAFRGYGGRFNNAYFVDTPEIILDDNLTFRKLSFKSWGNTKRLLELIQEDKELFNEFALTNMRIKSIYDKKDENDTVIDDITYSGRITSLGRSFRAHNEITMKIQKAYRHIVTNVIEDKYAIDYRDNSIKGSRLYFSFAKPISDILDFSERLFSGKQPFRLWGVSSFIEKDFTRVEVLDMHIGERFTVDIHNDKLIMMISSGVCGNSVMRLLTLLQQHLGSGVKLYDQDYNEVNLRIDNI